MSGIEPNTVVSTLIQEIKSSQETILKCVQEHNVFVNRSLEVLLNSISLASSTFERERGIESKIIKVRDPLDELKKIKKEIQETDLNEDKKEYYLNCIVSLLALYEENKISATFKEMFLGIFKKCLIEQQPSLDDSIELTTELIHPLKLKQEIKETILKVRDIRWLLFEMERLPQYFQFTDKDLDLMKSYNASRDNIFLIKKILQKDETFEDYFTEEEGGGIKCQIQFVKGVLNGTWKEYYPNDELKQETSYTNGEQNNEWKIWYSNGQLFVEGKCNGENTQWYNTGELMNKYTRINNKQEGEFKEWYKNGTLMIDTTYKNNIIVGHFKNYYPNGQLNMELCCSEGSLKPIPHFKIDGEFNQFYENGNLWIQSNYKYGFLQGQYKEWNKDGILVKECNYNNGQLHGEWKEYNTNGDVGDVIKSRTFVNNILNCTETNFYVDLSKNKNKCLKLNLDEELVVMLFYSSKMDNVESLLYNYKELPNKFSGVVYAMCDIAKYPSVFDLNKETNTPFKEVPTIYYYYNGVPWIKYDGSFTFVDNQLETFIKEGLYR